MFLLLHNQVGDNIDIVEYKGDGTLEYLVSPERFKEYARLSASMEVFQRCIRRAKEFAANEGHRKPEALGQALRSELDLPAELYGDAQFCAVAKRAGAIAHEKNRPAGLMKSVAQKEPKECYLCGKAPVTGAPLKLSADHLWPLSLGGETREENLLSACANCNNERGHICLWTFEAAHSSHKKETGKELRLTLRVSLAMSRLMLVASGKLTKGPRMTLKEAAQLASPLALPLKLNDEYRYLYFELLRHTEVPL